MSDAVIGTLLLIIGGTFFVGVFGACCVELVQKLQK